MAESINLSEIVNAWLARSGDVCLSSLINTILYAVSIAAAAYHWRMLQRFKKPAAEQGFWLLVIFILSIFGINKQLDFQVLLVEIGRPIALKSGWYESRRIVQAVFAFVLTGIAGLFAVMMLFLIRRHWRNNILALLGLLILCFYGIMEAMSQSHVGCSLELYEQWSFRLTDVIEMTGILFILANTLIRRKRE
ncbi:MAG TPA: hypothetical protein PKO34_00155 [Smithellaceae bacterium]|jgi:hypothetical protein|nr:hypothetical protein [Smithellaceae bacterium]